MRQHGRGSICLPALCALGVVPQREQGVVFRVVRGAAAGPECRTHHPKSVDAALHAVVYRRCDANGVAVRGPQARCRAGHNHSSSPRPDDPWANYVTH